jgi:hypothetical protein
LAHQLFIDNKWRAIGLADFLPRTSACYQNNKHQFIGTATPRQGTAREGEKNQKNRSEKHPRAVLLKLFPDSII